MRRARIELSPRIRGACFSFAPVSSGGAAASGFHTSSRFWTKRIAAETLPCFKDGKRANSAQLRERRCRTECWTASFGRGSLAAFVRSPRYRAAPEGSGHRQEFIQTHEGGEVSALRSRSSTP